ncbi:hypothetical protein OIU92_09330 [Escherichia coli]|nr:hypothetical protein [Escherichia coli]
MKMACPFICVMLRRSRLARKCAGAFAELNGEGEVAGGVVILRSGKNAREVISRRERQTGNAEK